MTVLVIDDDHDIRVLTRSTLEAVGYVVQTATNGFEGLILVRKLGIPDVIVLDDDMPLLNGRGFLEIKSSTPDLENVPVIMMTNWIDAQNLPVHAHLPKPFTQDALLKFIRELTGV
jgi:CheY-like chemotaxis protein